MGTPVPPRLLESLPATSSVPQASPRVSLMPPAWAMLGPANIGSISEMVSAPIKLVVFILITERVTDCQTARIGGAFLGVALVADLKCWVLVGGGYYCTFCSRGKCG